MDKYLAFTNQKSKSIVRLHHLKLISGTSLSSVTHLSLMLPPMYLKNTLILRHSLICYYKNFMKLLMYWFMEYEMT